MRIAKIKVKDINTIAIKELGRSNLITYPDLIIYLNKYSKSKIRVPMIPAMLFSINDLKYLIHHIRRFNRYVKVDIPWSYTRRFYE